MNLDEKFDNLDISLNYGTTKTNKKDVIYIGVNGKYYGDGSIGITIDEAKFLIEKLPKFIEAFEDEPLHRLQRVVNRLKGNDTLDRDEIVEELESIAKSIG